MLERFEIQTITDTDIAGAFTLREAAVVEAVAAAGGFRTVSRSPEPQRVGRIALAGLRPATEYTVRFAVSGVRAAELTVTTLPAPRGRKLAEFAIVADPHLTTCCENDRGRLYAESEAILRRTVAEINRRPTDFVLVPGDLTHLGSADEVALAREILDELQCPVLMVPGDHDMDGGKHDIYDAFGPGQWVERRDGLTIIGCDMIDIGTDRTGFCLGQAGVEHVLTALESADGPILMLCHRQFVPDDYVPDRSRAIGDHERFVQQVLAKLPPGTIAYVGHKNVAARFRQGNLLQLNVPQPVEYPCGTLRVRCFANGFYHSFVPMFSETLNDVSRVACNALGLRTRTESYKRGRGHGIWNFVWDPTTGRVVA